MKPQPIRVYVGWDPRDHAAYTVAVQSLLHHASVPVEIIPLVDRDLRRQGVYWRSYSVDHRGQMWDAIDNKPFSTQFSFSRFAVPYLEDYADKWVLFTDPDVMWRDDVANLFKCIERDKCLMVVKHDHRPREREKMDGVLQTSYERKNWSSVMLMIPSKCRNWDRFAVNNWGGSTLHQFKGFLVDEEIGDLDPKWNWLEGYTDPKIEPSLVHYTRGSPDMPGHEDAAYADEWWRYYNAANKGGVKYPLINVTSPTTKGLVAVGA